MKNLSKKTAKALAVSMFAVGFVTPVMFSDIAEAANFGKGGIGMLISQTEIDNANKSTGATYGTKWAKSHKYNTTTPSASNSVVITDKNGGTHLFKIVAASGTGTSATLTLWSYDNTFSNTKFNENSSDGNAYEGSELQKKTDALYDSTVYPTYEKAGILSNLSLEKLTTSTGSDPTITDKYVWIPSKTEVEGWTDSGLDGTKQRVIGDNIFWLRSPCPFDDGYACSVDVDGGFSFLKVDRDYLLRPALQILNQTSFVFTTNTDLSTLSTMNGGFTADCSGSSLTSYILNSSVTATFAPATDGVTLDGTKIGITASTTDDTNYKVAGLLTKVTSGTDNWDNLNGTTANIAYMAQVDGSELDLQNVDAGTDYNLKIFGLNTTDTTVTELANGAVNGLSIDGTGANAKIHMKIGGTYNNGVPVTLTNGASADLAGMANNDITVTDTGCLGGEGTLTGKVDGAGKLFVTGTVTADADKFTQTGGLEIKNNLNFTSRGLNVTNVGGFTQAAGSNVTVDASKIQADSNDPNQAMFTGVDAAGKLDVDDGNLTLSGVVYEDKYYVLAKGTAVTVSDLWKTENIDFSGVLLAEYDTNAAGNSIALKMTKVATFEEGSTSGLAAVQQGNISVAKEFTDEVANRLSFVQRPSLKAVKVEARDVANTNKDDYKVESIEQGNANEVMPVQVADEDKYDKEVWASYIRTKETTEGMKLEGIEGNNTAQYNGAVVGVDFYSSDKAIAGVAFSYTTGDIDSYSGETATRNKSKYYGVSFYDRVTNGNNALIYDIGYIKGDNDISQFYTGKETTADVKTDTYTAGVRYEAEFGTEKSRVVPFASFRYMRQNNKDYTNSHGTRFESSNQNLYIPKVGIAWTGDFTAPNSVCTWRPSVEAGYVWNLGDRSVDGNVLMGTTIAGVEYDTVDKSSYYAKAGMEFSCKNFTAGLFYRYLKGSAVRNNKWNVNVAWSF